MNTIHYQLLGGKVKVKDIKHFLKNSYEKDLNKHTNHGDYEIDKDLSGRRFQAYYNPNNNHLITVHRGTSGLNDWITDLNYAFNNKNNKRFKHARDSQKKAEDKYSTKNISVLGHSLGKALAEHSNINHHEQIGLNGAENFQDTFKPKQDNQYHIKTSLDPISIFSNLKPKSKNNLTIHSKSFNPIKEHSTDVLNRINQELEIGKE
eukprot:gene7398-10087_t